MEHYTIALAGNPNVGKSTVFNALTGMNQHTGNWPGKTVQKAEGTHTYKDKCFNIVDLPGTYSLLSHSKEEEVARDFICFGGIDAVIVVCDATCLERNLNLVLQTMEITSKVIVCINLMDEAKKRNIDIDMKALTDKLGTIVLPITARSKTGLDTLDEALYQLNLPENKYEIRYPNAIESALNQLVETIEILNTSSLSSRWIALKLLEGDQSLIDSLSRYHQINYLQDEELNRKLTLALYELENQQIARDNIKDHIVSKLICTAEQIAKEVVKEHNSRKADRDRKIDRFFTNRITGIPVMILLLLLIFWITITGANYPSSLLSDFFSTIQIKLTDFFHYLNAPDWLHEALILGIYRVVTWVIAVMLPPMAIFFPLFTLLEDFGYLPRIAYNLDHVFKRCHACGKQALTMCQGFGCNAVGIIGCRIIDSPRERLIAIITNNFVPCNGRFPTIISIISIFFVGTLSGITGSFLSTLLLTGVIVLGVLMTFLISKLLSATVLKGVPSSFTLELPPYRRPQIGKVIIRSIMDRTLFVLARAVIIAAPAGLIIWLTANINIAGTSILTYCTDFLDPFARLFGLDGVILMAFILGFPANEIVIPIMLMAYLSTGSLIELDSLSDLQKVLVDNGWTWLTAINVIFFSLMHWPCSTTCLTIKKETGSIKWTAISFLVPLLTGLIICFVFTQTVHLLQFLF